MPSALVLLDLIFVGFFLTYLVRSKFLLEERIIFGTLISLIIFGYAMLFLSYLFKALSINLIIFLLSFNLINLLNIFKYFHQAKLDFKNFLERFKHFSWKIFLAILLIFIFLFSFLISQLITQRDGGYFVKPMHAFGDISGHLGLVSAFAYGENIPPQNPILAGEKISYPFLVDFITSIFVNPLNLKPHQAVQLTGIVMMIIFISSIAYICFYLTKNKFVSCLVLLLFLFNGGLGFIYFFEDLKKIGFNLSGFLEISRDYTALKEEGIWWINIVISMLMPQRGILLGLPTSLLIIRIFWDLAEGYIFRNYIFGLLLINALPIIHAHSLLAIFPFLIWLTLKILLRNSKEYKQIFLAGLIALIITLLLSKTFLKQSDNIFQMMRIQFGWVANGKDIPLFYLKNFGFYLLSIPIGLFIYLQQRSKLATFIVIGQLLFFIPSLVVFQAWDYDNTKLLIYWLFIVSVSLSIFTYELIVNKKLILSIILIIGLTLSGILDVTRLFYSPKTSYQIYAGKDFKLAEFIKNNTAKDAIFLSVDKFDNPAVTLAGRKIILGFRGWIWTHGLDFTQREQDVRFMLSGQADEQLFKKYHISYVILFNEQSDFIINQNYFDHEFQKIYDVDGFLVYKLWKKS